jgi:hypothetical protein
MRKRTTHSESARELKFRVKSDNEDRHKLSLENVEEPLHLLKQFSKSNSKAEQAQ